MSKLLPVALSAVLALAACEMAPTPGDAVAAPTSVAYAIYGNPQALVDGRTPEELGRIVRENLRVIGSPAPGTDVSYRRLFNSEVPLAEKDRAAARLLDAHPGLEWVHLRQIVATDLLTLHLRTGSDDTTAIERYTRVLVEAESPSADLIAEALDHLTDAGRWSAAERAAAADVAAAAAADWLAQNCETCGARRRAAASGERAEQLAAKRRAVAAALPALDGR